MEPPSEPPECLSTVDCINEDRLRTALLNWRKGKSAPKELLRLHLLDHIDAHWLLNRDAELYELVQNKALEKLALVRQMMRISYYGDRHLQQVAADFQGSNVNITSALWIYSALYHRHIIPVEISPVTLAETAGISERHFRRLVNAGIKLLALELRRMEAEHIDHPGDC